MSFPYRPAYPDLNDEDQSCPSACWWVYLLCCADETLYTGVTTNPERRVRQHNGELVGGARYTRARRPVFLVYQERCASRSEAGKREAVVRKLSRRSKIALINSVLKR